MNMADCPYTDGKCGEHANCVKCTPHNQWIEYLKSKIENNYRRCIPDDAAWKTSKYIKNRLNDGIITDADASELQQHNGKLRTTLAFK